MSSDPVFPFYRVGFHYDCGEGTPEERTSLLKPWLFKEDPGADTVLALASLTWPNITWRDETPKVRRLLRITVTREADVAWALGWFSHETFRVGRTNAELRDSFERFVRQWEPYQEHLSDAPKGTPCLMGAEDRWRWQPVCQCATCTERDIALIAH